MKADPRRRPLLSPTIAFEARSLLRAARVGTVAALGRDAGDPPHASLVTPAVTADGTIVLFLSGLSEHTRLLHADGRCALLVTGPAPGANPQLTPRLTLRGHARQLDGDAAAAARAHYLRIHPYAVPYAGLADFAPWAMTVADALHVAGFGRARTMRAADLFPAADAVRAVERAAPALLSRLAPLVVAIDNDGVDIRADGDATRRVAFDVPATDADGLARAVDRLADDGALA